MRLIAFRPEYQLTVEDEKNRLFYQNFGQMQQATNLPNYREDWAAALLQVRPGFSILSDMQVVNQVNQDLLAEFQAVEQLIVQRGVSMVAEVHVPGLPTRRCTDEITTSQAMPVRQFLNIWEAEQFLDDLTPELAPGASGL
ncbi:hypothetical protein Q3A66_15225 [Hymenobacter sp. BT770]|uniref:hypothetical protein n=1 Tax=Hymenobacter sp. BT770 TaxID=2886942 RepID=UPI001D121366|nr:hypothetical protein [Hymenobacter sp. BT770]MCC3154516.1 hypothetical protein [Hymenobacter sp. BT770]MDO3416420.1 hypothetical protein [Hymenobacter sp. BT770]